MSEAWRKEVNLDDIVATWEYPEREQMFKFYPQYYHKTDKVGDPFHPADRPQVYRGRRSWHNLR